jgi:5-methylthioribose kinase
MQELTPQTATAYLRVSGRAAEATAVSVRELPGGVSNIVLRVDIEGQPAFVLKQCREKLRVAMDWRARLDRIWMEHATLELLGQILPEGMVPRVLFVDRSNYLFAMTCAPDDAVTWKSLLLAGSVDQEIAARLGTILGTIHAESPGFSALHETLADVSLFDELRVDPYYRTAARAHPELAGAVTQLIAAMDRPRHERTLVLGDFSPKNILVDSRGLTLLDFECAHAGDAAFDLGFFLSHLLLKMIRATFLQCQSGSTLSALPALFLSGYLARTALSPTRAAELVRRASVHTGACALARVDGKSPVEYLDARGQAAARAFGQQTLREQPGTWDEVRQIFDAAVEKQLTC